MAITAESELAADDFQEVLELIAVMDVENGLEDLGTSWQRKHLMQLGPVHPDAEEALQILLGQDPREPEMEPEEALRMQELIRELDADLDLLGEGENDPDGDDGEEE